MKNNNYFCTILMELEFSREILAKYSNTKFHENPPSGKQIARYGRTDMTKLMVAFSQFCERA